MFAQTTRHCQCLPRNCRHFLQATPTCPTQERAPPQHTFRCHSRRAHGCRGSSAAERLRPFLAPQKHHEVSGSPTRRYSSKPDSSIRPGRDHYPQDANRSRRGVAGIDQIGAPHNNGLQWLMVQEMRSPPSPSFRGPPDRYGLFEALQLGTPSQLVHMLATASQDQEYMRNLPRTVWVEILRFMAPKRWLPRASGSHDFFFDPDPEYNQEYGSTTASADELLNAISEIVRVRRQTGVPMDFVDYKTMMSHAKDLANLRMARSVIQDMRADGFDPDLDCWNFYTMTMLLVKQQQTGLLKWSYDNALKQSVQEPGPPKLYNDGLLASVRSVYESIRHKPGIAFDTTTYCIYMTALARDGEFEAVSEILRNTWGLDTDDLDADIPEDKIYPRRDILHPTRRLLRTIAEVYGSNEELEIALKLIDKVSQRYRIPLEAELWRSILLWTWVHARRRQQIVREKNRDITRNIEEETRSQFFDPASVTRPSMEIPADQLQAFDAMFAAMRAENPTLAKNMNILHLDFYNKLGQGLTGTDSLTHPVLLGKVLHNRLLRAQASAASISKGIRSRRPDAKSNSGDVPWSKGGAAVNNYLTQMQLDVKISGRYLRNWIRRVIETGVPDRYIDNTTERERVQIHRWWLCGIPDLIARTLTLLPQRVRYQVPGGTVRLDVGPLEEQVAALQMRQISKPDELIAQREEMDESIDDTELFS